MTEVRVVGTGMSSFGKFGDRDDVDLALDAVTDALDVAGIGPQEIDAVFYGSVAGFGAGQRAMVRLGLGRRPVVNTENACATSATALYLANLAMRAGEFRTCLVVGSHSYSAMRSSGPATGPAAAGETFSLAQSLPGMYALIARRHMSDHGTTPEQLALVSVKNHHNGSLNPKAHYRDELTVDQVLTSRVIADPLTLYQCCPRTDGAAALVLSAEPGAVGPRVRSCVLGSGDVSGGSETGSWGTDLVAATAAEAWGRSGVEPRDVDVFEVHDAFTIGELVSYEGLGLCEPGGAGRLVEDRVTWHGGTAVVNAGGGLLARGHPVAATGAAMVAEIADQLMGRAGATQVEAARLGVAETMGGGTEGMSGNACCVTVLEAP